MGCIYEDNEGKCSLALDGDGELEQDMQGSDNGDCVVSDDPDPSISCDSYESDWTCLECGADLNAEECSCNEEE